MKRGEVWWASLGTPRGSEPGYRRPVLVVQANEFNDSNIGTAIVAVISSNLQLAAAPGNQLVRKKETRLSRDSVVNVSQLITINKSALTERVSSLPGRRMAAVDEGLKLVLGIA
jgi:mRNA interferase MazF